ncbi:MAG: hypothetical protein ACLR8P_04995 [Clostridium fessum]
MECIFGARKYQSGTILLNGKEVRFTTPIHRQSRRASDWCRRIGKTGTCPWQYGRF